MERGREEYSGVGGVGDRCGCRGRSRGRGKEE